MSMSNKEDWVCAVIIDDEDDDNVNEALKCSNNIEQLYQVEKVFEIIPVSKKNINKNNKL